MSLTILKASGAQAAGQAAQGLLRGALADGGRAVLLVPTFDEGLRASQTLAQAGGLSLGVTVTTPAAWLEERWEVWGEGRHEVTSPARAALVKAVLDTMPEKEAPTLARSKGTVDALCSLVRDALAWLPAPDAPATVLLTPGECEALAVAGAYATALHDRGLLERCEMAALLPGRLKAAHVPCPPLVAVGFSSMPEADRRLLASMASQAQVTLVVPDDGTPAAGLAAEVAQGLARLAEEAGASVVWDEAQAQGAPAPKNAAGEEGVSPELASLVAALVSPAAPQPVPTGAVRCLQPAGPVAEWELVASEVAACAEEGAREVVVAVPDAMRTWEGLAPKLASRGLLAQAGVSKPLSSLPAAQQFLAWAKLVARLAETPEPAMEDSPCGPVPRLVDMDWWPPRELTDFLLSDITDVSPQRAWRLDERWRGDRTLTAQAALDCLLREKDTSRSVARATAALLKGRVGTAATILWQSMAARGTAHGPKAPSSWQDSMDCLAAIAQAAREMGGVGIAFVGAKPEAPFACTLSALVGVLEAVLWRETLVARLELGPGDSHCTVRIATRGEAAKLAARSADAVALCGLTSAEWPLAPDDGALSVLLGKLGLLARPDPLAQARMQLAALASLPRRRLLLEASPRDAEGKPTYPAVVATELLARYGVPAGEEPDAKKSPELAPLVPVGLAETRVSEVVSASGTPAKLGKSETLRTAGTLSEEARPLVVVPNSGDTELPLGLKPLSATQIESYLECPCKWFTLRRLGLTGLDADFGSMQKGTFVHRVLEETRTRMLEEAAGEAGLVEARPLESKTDDFDQASFAQAFVPGARVDARPERAHELLDHYFDEHLAHQRLSGTKLRSQALVPHTATEEYELTLLRRDLHAELDFEAGVLEGFSPRYFELRFGGSGPKAAHVAYAGVDLNGRIDRVDVDGHGNAVVIDYKHKGWRDFASEHDAFGKDGYPGPEGLELPRRVQTLAYAQMVRRLYPQLNVVGALYLCTTGDNPKRHVLAGAVSENLAEGVTGRRGKALARVAVGGGRDGFYQFLDACEDKVAEAVQRLLAGDIAAAPKDDKACEWCPVERCPMRRSNHA